MVAVVEEPGPYHWWGQADFSDCPEGVWKARQDSVSGSGAVTRELAFGVRRERSQKWIISRRTVAGTPARLQMRREALCAFWHQDTASSGFCCSCHSTGEVKVIYGRARPGLINLPHHLHRPLRGGMTGVSHPIVSRGQGLRNAETSPLP